jgi:NAD+ synthase (glutamine-hydrolysing)
MLHHKQGLALANNWLRLAGKMSFLSIYRHDFVRVAACVHRSSVANPDSNAKAILALAKTCHEQSAGLVVFPELTISGYAIEDLLQQQALLRAVECSIADIVAASIDLFPVLVLGAPLRSKGAVYNCALVIHRGQILGVVPKLYLPNYREFYERRHFTPGFSLSESEIRIASFTAPFGTDLLFEAADLEGFCIGIEICEDMWIPVSPASRLALAGATVLVNPSGSPITIGRARDRELLAQSCSARCLAAYIFSAAGAGESTTDLAWDGQTAIFECGVLLAEGDRFSQQPSVTIADLDLGLLRQERASMGTFHDNRQAEATGSKLHCRRVSFALKPPTVDVGFIRNIERFPFVPHDPKLLDQDCYEAFNIQVSGLAQRLRAAGSRSMVIGVSGGLDSAHALVVAAKAADLIGLPRASIFGFTMPGFATSTRSKNDALALMQALGAEAHELDIRDSAKLMLKQIGHPAGHGQKVYDVTFENVQAGLRTDYLFRIANLHQGMVIGTGDLSELALGWCTYGVGDQMSHYAVNAGVPKTLIQHLIRWTIHTGQFEATTRNALQHILDARISPELVPAELEGEVQSSEAIVGPYELQDFNLFYTLRRGFRPSKIAFLSYCAWGGRSLGRWPSSLPEHQRHSYDLHKIRHWLEVFLSRFFGASQFKRSAMPNGPKVVAGGSLSPRGDWRAPSDGNATVWIDDLLSNVPDRADLPS